MHRNPFAASEIFKQIQELKPEPSVDFWVGFVVAVSGVCFFVMPFSYYVLPKHLNGIPQIVNEK